MSVVSVSTSFWTVRALICSNTCSQHLLPAPLLAGLCFGRTQVNKRSTHACPGMRNPKTVHNDERGGAGPWPDQHHQGASVTRKPPTAVRGRAGGGGTYHTSWASNNSTPEKPLWGKAQLTRLLARQSSLPVPSLPLPSPPPSLLPCFAPFLEAAPPGPWPLATLRGSR